MPTILKTIGHSGLFDTAFYLSRNTDLQELGSGALLHYHTAGWREGRKPNPFFDPLWYLASYRDVTEDPLHHYILRGEYEGRHPVPWFDPIWYRQANQVPANMNALAHYLANRKAPGIRPMPEFDPEFYLRSYPDVASSGMDRSSITWCRAIARYVAPLRHSIQASTARAICVTNLMPIRFCTGWRIDTSQAFSPACLSTKRPLPGR
ncbi:hypothetical protein [Asaia platycodi]|uniref:hypothetical protein n=1 Tax=Asaia platycodi TaxID=610243 RepID=UPI000684C7F1|nr:hypothetical protein [Asaia platycodi]